MNICEAIIKECDKTLLEFKKIGLNKHNAEIFCDMDGVLADFKLGYKRAFGKEAGNQHITDWTEIDAVKDFWINLPWMRDGVQLWGYIQKYKPYVLTSPSKSTTAKAQKKEWAKRLSGMDMLLFCQKSKKHIYATPTRILIDDYPDTVARWNDAGGIGILHTSAANTIAELKKLGL